MRLLEYAILDKILDRPDEYLRNHERISKACFPFEQAFGRFSLGRRFCVTEAGYMGWVPLYAKVGDELCIFRGNLIPFALRKSGDGYRLHGECYLYGLMNGEAIELPHAEEIEIRLI